MADIIFALDYSSIDEALKMVRLLRGEINLFKVGLQLFTAAGPDSVRAVRELGAEVFLDLKLHDIPNTCAAAVREAARLGAYSATIHTAAGPAALEAAAAGSGSGGPFLWGVTLLSSITGTGSLERAEAAHRAGLDGVVVSGKDAAAVRRNFPDLRLIVPGIRPAGLTVDSDDQKKTLTPAEAAEAGADFIVIGRPLRESKDPLTLAAKIREEVSGD